MAGLDPATQRAAPVAGFDPAICGRKRSLWLAGARLLDGRLESRPWWSGMKVLIPTPLRSYTRAREVDAEGATVGEVLADLDRRYPGFRFRMVDEQDQIRRHMRLFVNGEQSFDLAQRLRAGDSIPIVQALSGG